jgi:hypothetical protein
MLIKAIFLIISSSNHPIYEELRKLQRVYLNNYRPLIKYFFIEFREQEEMIIEDNDFLYINGEESVNPGMIIKTAKAIEYIDSKYNYEFIVRTNLSTLFHMPNLLEYLYGIPNTNSCGGFTYRSFITGTGIILSRDVANKIVENLFYFDILKYNEDLIVSAILNKLQIPYFNSKIFYKWGLVIEAEPENYGEYYYIDTSGKEYKDIEFPDNILHFRIKNDTNRNKDIYYFKLLLNKIYNIII